MKRLIIVVVLAFVLACGQVPGVEDSEGVQSPASEPSAVDLGIDIVDAMESGDEFVCTFTHEGQTSSFFMKDGLLRMDTAPADAHAIYTEDSLYMWVAKQGTKVDRKSVGSLGEVKSQKDIVAEASNHLTVCKQVPVDDVLFTPPEDVVFQDLTEVIRQAEVLTR